MNHSASHDRRQELQADRALFGLTPDEQTELEGLLSEGSASGSVGPDEFELAAGALAVAMQGAQPQELPPQLRARILAASHAAAAPSVPSPGVPAAALASPSSASGGGATALGRRELLAWFVAAAAVLVAVFLGFRPLGDVSAQSPAQLRGDLLARRAQDPGAAVQATWTRGEDEAAAAAEGDVVWSDSAQAGVMRFRGLAANDPTQSQYQLWIFDAERDDAHPVDGGVFDIPAGEADVFVPIRARLPIGKAKMFAVTIERPGGVVVSDRSRLPLLAQLP